MAQQYKTKKHPNIFINIGVFFLSMAQKLSVITSSQFKMNLNKKYVITIDLRKRKEAFMHGCRN